MEINIAFGATENWLGYTYVTICSILANARAEDDYNFYIMCDKADVNFKPMCKCLDMIKPSEYEFIQMDNSLFKGAIHDPLGVSSSYRLKLPSLLKENKVLYLDSDVIVLNDISKLYEYDISDYYIAAVEDKLSDLMKPRVDFKENDIYINGGVQLLNLDMFRKNNLEELIFEKLRQTLWTDQDVINYVCKDKILQLPLIYNIMALKDNDIYKNRRKEYEDALEAPVILHFTNKPWKEEVKYGEYWFMYADLLTQLLNTL